MMRVAMLLVLAATFLMPSNLFAQHDNKIITRDHLVPHTSTVPANAGELVQLFVRERFLGDENDLEPSEPLKAVLMVHGRSVPVLPGMDLRHDDYSWAFRLARAGFDVFMLDFQGSGLSPRPMMADPCNVNPAQQTNLIPNGIENRLPLSAPCPATYPKQLINTGSDWAELDAVVDYIRAIRAVDKVALVSWSEGAFRVGPYAIQHPEKVESVLFFAPIFNPGGRPSEPGTRFGAPVTQFGPLPVTSPAAQFGFPMTLSTKTMLMTSWDNEQSQQCQGQREEGIQDVVWSSIMDNDTVGRAWGRVLPDGSVEGVMRVRNPFLWGWNSTTVAFDGTLGRSVPVLIIYGELDTQVAAPFSVPALYNAIPGNHKLLFKVACAGHYMVWESQRRVLHHISKQWLKHGAVEGFTTGSFFVDPESTILPQ